MTRFSYHALLPHLPARLRRMTAVLTWAFALALCLSASGQEPAAQPPATGEPAPNAAQAAPACATDRYPRLGVLRRSYLKTS